MTESFGRITEPFVPLDRTIQGRHGLPDPADRCGDPGLLGIDVGKLLEGLHHVGEAVLGSGQVLADLIEAPLPRIGLQFFRIELVEHPNRGRMPLHQLDVSAKRRVGLRAEQQLRNPPHAVVGDLEGVLKRDPAVAGNIGSAVGPLFEPNGLLAVLGREKRVDDGDDAIPR